ncbi:hypothetical protein AB0D11_44175 [Streptomyces monashensis]|uniref:hypothetical protein n=1 Tax=Streptomyces monashensis TaxID=1678012 RepID=UPI0033FF37CF
MRGGQMQGPGSSEAEINATFGRVLDRALNSRELLEALEHSDGVLNREQLRTRALQARGEIVGAAAAEHRAFLEARATAAATRREEGAGGVERAEAGGSGGLLPVLAVLVPSLAAVSAAVFLVTGYGLRAFGGRPHISDGLITAGLIAAAVTAGGLIGDFVYVLVAAARNRADGQGDALDGSAPEVTRAREEWELALLERGVMPFLLRRLEEADDAHRRGRQAR